MDGNRPTFLGIGAQKAGTTWLHGMLRLHPDIGMHPVKETHFWDRNWSEGKHIERYQADFAAIPEPIRGEITPAYAILEPRVISIMHEHFPDLRLLYILRNPMERAWSHAKMRVLNQKRKGHMLEGHLIDVDRVPDEWYIDHFHSPNSLRRGDYEACLRNWRGIYEPERLRVLLYDDLLEDPRRFLQECCRHIGADAGFYAAVDDAKLRQRLGPTSEDPIRPSLLPVLRDIYAPKIEALSAYLDIDLMRLWVS